MARNAAGIIFCVMAGFFIYGAGLLAFMHMPQDVRIPEGGAVKAIVMGVSSVLALIFLVPGILLYRSGHWMSTAGVVLISATGLNLLVAVTFICIQLTPELREFLPEENLSFFSDYVPGFSVMAATGGLGGLLLMAGKKRVEARKT